MNRHPWRTTCLCAQKRIETAQKTIKPNKGARYFCSVLIVWKVRWQHCLHPHSMTLKIMHITPILASLRRREIFWCNQTSLIRNNKVSSTRKRAETQKSWKQTNLSWHSCWTRKSMCWLISALNRVLCTDCCVQEATWEDSFEISRYQWPGTAWEPTISFSNFGELILLFCQEMWLHHIPWCS